jgi:hypothetical protein
MGCRSNRKAAVRIDFVSCAFFRCCPNAIGSGESSFLRAPFRGTRRDQAADLPNGEGEEMIPAPGSIADSFPTGQRPPLPLTPSDRANRQDWHFPANVAGFAPDLPLILPLLVRSGPCFLALVLGFPDPVSRSCCRHKEQTSGQSVQD